MTEVFVKWTNPKVMLVSEFHDDCKRYRWTRVRWTKPDGDYHFHDDFMEVPDIGPLVFIPEGPDVDASAVDDLIAFAKRPKRRQREKQDVTKMYHEFNERRARELDTKTVHAAVEVP